MWMICRPFLSIKFCDIFSDATLWPKLPVWQVIQLFEFLVHPDSSELPNINFISNRSDIRDLQSIVSSKTWGDKLCNNQAISTIGLTEFFRSTKFDIKAGNTERTWSFEPRSIESQTLSSSVVFTSHFFIHAFAVGYCKDFYSIRFFAPDYTPRKHNFLAICSGSLWTKLNINKV